ncbi:GNAT family N-acetyltransferase, partial [Vibrio splendidus]
SDPRTEKIVSEPRADNDKMIGYLQKYGFAKVKEFEFPHKRAALMCQLKDSFFSNEF